MNVMFPKNGRYLIAVSGGLDSVCLLNIMYARSGYDLIVAHFDHGIRPESQADHDFVKNLAAEYKLEFVSSSGSLGENASEATSREARYNFLFQAMHSLHADAVVTAHHMDDRLETLIINLIRGTGRRGIASIGQTENLKRPLLKVSREELKGYAQLNGLLWRDDPSNFDNRYLRNYIRASVLPRINARDKLKLIKLMDDQTELNAEIDRIISGLMNKDDIEHLDLKLLNGLPYNVSTELVATWLRRNNLINFNRKTIERVVIAAKTHRPGKQVNVYGKAAVNIEKTNLALVVNER
jgi:tRNA(Ile)-lysidine synthase